MKKRLDLAHFYKNNLPMPRFVPQTSGIGSVCSANWATTTAHVSILVTLKLYLRIGLNMKTNYLNVKTNEEKEKQCLKECDDESNSVGQSKPSDSLIRPWWSSWSSGQVDKTLLQGGHYSFLERIPFQSWFKFTHCSNEFNEDVPECVIFVGLFRISEV